MKIEISNNYICWLQDENYRKHKQFLSRQELSEYIKGVLEEHQESWEKLEKGEY